MTGPSSEAQRRWILLAVGGVATAVVSVPLAAAAGAPYMSLEHVNGWVVTFALGLFAAVFAAPFLIRAGLDEALDFDARWERALLWWGGGAIALLVLGLLTLLAGGSPSDSLAGALGVVTAAEAALVIGTLAVWLASN